MTHVTARQEVETLLNGLNLGGLAAVTPAATGAAKLLRRLQ